MARLSYLLTLTPLETWRLLRRRVPGLRGGPAWTAQELLSSGKLNRGIRFAELLLRQEAVLRRHMPWEPLSFSGRKVLEIGCGPLGGFGPLAIFCGASSFQSAEPEWDEALFFCNAVRDKYLRVFHADLAALFGSRMEFEEFYDALKHRMLIHRAGFERSGIEAPVDVVLSQSCLEHVFPLEATVARLSEIQTAQTRFLHLVDFGNHYPTGNAFDGLYQQPPDAYIARRGNAINLLRTSDVAAMFAKHDIAAKVIPSRIEGRNLSGVIHPWWRERYDDATLLTQLALVAGPCI